MSWLVVDVSGAGDHTLIAGVAGQTIPVNSIVLVMGALTTMRFRSAANNLSGPMAGIAGTTVVVYPPSDGTAAIKPTEIGESLILNLAGLAPVVGGWLEYAQS
jgi:hypothetical protein